jgi:hypothetical protein
MEVVNAHLFGVVQTCALPLVAIKTRVLVGGGTEQDVAQPHRMTNVCVAVFRGCSTCPISAESIESGKSTHRR